MTIAKHTLTVFNKYLPPLIGPFPSEAQWIRTVIKYGQWENQTDRNFNQQGITNIDKHISIVIPKTAKTDSKKYVTPIDWAAMTYENKLLSWTIKEEDYIFFGEIPEITSLFTMTIAKEQYTNCMVKTVEDLFTQPILPHIEVIGV